MFSGRMEVLTDADGWILIDRNGKHFGAILNYLRDGTIPLPDTRRELMELQAEAKYYCVDELVLGTEQSLGKLGVEGSDVVPICRVPLITSPREEQALITANNMKPVVKLLINRHNNKYSYTGASDDNLLKNNEICCWSFYGHGKKIAEVCCTAIVYATDRKNTKVEFPEARIYEETLNCLLYENRTGPDQDLMQATSTRGAGTSYTSDDEDERNRLGGEGGAAGGAPVGPPGARSHSSGLARLRSNKNS